MGGKRKGVDTNGNCSPFLRQLFVSSGVVVNIIGHGSVTGFAAIMLPQLRASTSDIKINDQDASWIASIFGCALMVGNVISPFLMSKYGRKFTHLGTTVPITIGWFTLILAQSVPILILGRFLQGLSLGMQAPLGAVIIGEYASPKNRGLFLISVSLGLAIGVVLAHVLGTYISWQYTALASSLFSFVSFLIITYSPETPSWLASKGKYDKCRENFFWLRGKDDEEQNEELEVMIEDAKNEKSNKTTDTLRTTIKKKEFYKPVLVLMHLYVMTQFCGLNVLISYTIDILHILIGKEENVHAWMISLDILRLITTIVAAVAIKKLPRRFVLYFSGILCVACLFSIAAYSYAKSLGLIQINWVPVILLYIYMFSISFGMLPIPFAVAGELLPVAYRSLGGGISVLMLSLLCFITLKTAPLLFNIIGLHGTYTVYASILVYCLLFLWFNLPETKDRTLYEIECEFKGIRLDLTNVDDFKSMQSLQSLSKSEYHASRRCSNTIII